MNRCLDGPEKDLLNFFFNKTFNIKNWRVPRNVVRLELLRQLVLVSGCNCNEVNECLKLSIAFLGNEMQLVSEIISIVFE